MGTGHIFFIFLGAFLETSAFLGILVPGETLVIFAGFLASRGVLDIGDCIWIIALGAFLGDTVGYAIGARIGNSYFQVHSRLIFLKRSHIERAEQFFKKHGSMTIILGRFVGFLRAFVPLIAGMSRMPYLKFLIYNLAGGILWTLCFTLLGYYFGQSWHLVEKWAGKVGLFIFLIALLVFALAYLYRKVVKNQTASSNWMGRSFTRLASSPYETLHLGFILTWYF